MTKKEEIANMATQQVMATQPQGNSLKTFNNAICSDGWNNYLTQVLGERKGEFINNIVALVSGDVGLQQCTPSSLIYSAIKATSLNLPIDKNLGFAWIIKYNDNRTNTAVAQFQMGYKGFVQLAIRSGQYARMNATDVKQGELAKRDRLTGKYEWSWVDDDAERAKLPTIGYVCYFELTNGFNCEFYMSEAEIEDHASEFSQTYKSDKRYSTSKSLWSTNRKKMALKTVTKLALSKYGVLSVEMRNATKYDQATFESEDNYRYVDNDEGKSDFEEAVMVDNGHATEGGEQ